MKKLLFIVTMFFCRDAICQISGDKIIFALKNTSLKKQYIIIFKDSKKQDRAIWSNYFLEYIHERRLVKSGAIEWAAEKILKNDTFNIDKTDYSKLCAIINMDTLQLLRKNGNSITTFINQYFQNYCIRHEYLHYRWEIASLLWHKNKILFITTDNISPIPQIETFKKNNLQNHYKAMNGKKKPLIYFYFPKYDFFVDAATTDTSFIYNTLRKKTDQEILNVNHYFGTVEYLKIEIGREQKKLKINLFDKDENNIGSENYRYVNMLTIKSDTIFYNLTGTSKIVKRKIIIPLQY